MVNNQQVSINTIELFINNYIASISQNKDVDKVIQELIYKFYWTKNSNKEIWNRIVEQLIKSHFIFIENELKRDGIIFPLIKERQWIEFKKKYPFSLYLDYVDIIQP